MDVRHRTEVDGFLCQLHLPQAQLFTGNDREQGGKGHQTQTTDLDQQQDNDLPEPAPVGKGIIGDQSGHTGGRGSGEHAVHQRCKLPGFGGNGQAEQNGSHQDHQGKAQADHTQRLRDNLALLMSITPIVFDYNFRLHSFFTLLSSANRSESGQQFSIRSNGKTCAAETSSHD